MAGDYWDGMTNEWSDYSNCESCGAAGVSRAGGVYTFYNTYGSQWTGPNFDGPEDRPFYNESGGSLASNSEYVFEIRLIELNEIKTRLTVSIPNGWGNCSAVDIYPTESYTKPDGSLGWRNFSPHVALDGGGWSQFLNIYPEDHSGNGKTFTYYANGVDNSGNRTAHLKFRVKTGNLPGAMDLRIALQYGDCEDQNGGWTDCNSAGGCNSTCSTADNLQVNHGLQQFRIDRLSFTRTEAIGGWDANFSREQDHGFSAVNGNTGNVSIDSSYVNYAVGRRGLRYNTAGCWSLVDSGTDNRVSDSLRRIVVETEGFGSPLPPHNGQPVQGVLAVKPRQDLLYRSPIHADLSWDNEEWNGETVGVNNDPMIIDAPTLIYDSNNFLRGFILMLHSWNYDVAHRWKVQWKLYLPVDYIMENKLQDKMVNLAPHGMQVSTAEGRLAFDSRLESMEPKRAERVMSDYYCCSNSNSSVGSEGNLYQWSGAIGSCSGQGYDDDGDYRADYDSHAFYITNSVSVNNLVKNREEYLIQGVGTPESMYRASAETNGWPYGFAHWGCAFAEANAGIFNMIPMPGEGCSSAGYSMTGGQLTGQQMCQMNLYGIGAPMQSPGGSNSDHNTNSYRVASNTIFVLSDYIERYQHAVYPHPSDTVALDDGLERYEQMLIGNGWKMVQDQAYPDENANEHALYFEDIDGGYSTAPWTVNYSNNPDAYGDDGVGAPAGVGVSGMKGHIDNDGESSFEFTWGFTHMSSTTHNFSVNISQHLWNGVGCSGGGSGMSDCSGSGNHKVCSGVTDTVLGEACEHEFEGLHGSAQNAWDNVCCEKACSQSCTPNNEPLGKTFTYNVWVKPHTRVHPAPKYWLINVSKDRTDAVAYETRVLCQNSDQSSWYWCATGRAYYNHYAQSGYPY